MTLATSAATAARGRYVTRLDLGAAGAVTTTGWDRKVRSTGTEAKDRKRSILKPIRPPVDDSGQILRKAGEHGSGVRG
jgi:NADH dehydrogenase